uniref:Thioesterase domain-containing protein n=1 Tax=Panagrolaimus sp. PS1159 TaxID=55785 RepID=A0AC35GPN7_9BILA
MSNKYFNIVKAMYTNAKVTNNFMKVASGVRLMDVSEGKVKLEFEVTEELTNPMGTLHGGATSTMIDIATTTALLATSTGKPGVTVNLNVACLAPAKLGETVILDAEVIKSGRSIAFTEATLYRKSDQTIVATGQHTKAFPSQKSS